MMITRSEIHQSFVRSLVLLHQAEKDAWLIKGDFEHFKLTNELYSPLITDYLLDWAVEVIEGELLLAQRNWRCGELLCNVVGDDVTISIPPSSLSEKDVARLLWRMREALWESFWHRYVVGAVPLPEDYFDEINPDSLEMMRRELKAIRAVVDFARRQRGYLLLLPVEQDGAVDKSFARVIDVIQHWTGKRTPPMTLLVDRIFNPVDAAWHTFNDGFVHPPQVSFAACPARMSISGGMPDYERVSLACQEALKVCKQQRRGVWVSPDSQPPQNAFLAADAFQQHQARAGHIHWSSERSLRETLYFRQLNQPVLFQFNPVYIPDQLPCNFLHIEKYRGNLYGVGLKGINEICGQHAADRVIRQWLSVCSDQMRTALSAKGIAPERVLAAQFVDRFTVYCAEPVFDLVEIATLVGRLAVEFNKVSHDIKVSQVRNSIVFGGASPVGYQLFHQLDLTSRSPRCALLEDYGVPVEVRQNSGAALEEGRVVMERESLASARRMAVLDECVLS